MVYLFASSLTESGSLLNPKQTPATLDLCDGAQIDCVRVQIGGEKTGSQKRGFSQSSHDSDKRQRGSHASEGGDAEPSEGERVVTKQREGTSSL